MAAGAVDILHPAADMAAVQDTVVGHRAAVALGDAAEDQGRRDLK